MGHINQSKSEQARELFGSLGLSYSDITEDDLVDLRNSINLKMRNADYFRGAYRCNDKIERERKSRKKIPNPFYAAITCRAHYFDHREAVTFNTDGFIGFAGWSDSHNIVPIHDAFSEWCVNLSKRVKEND